MRISNILTMLCLVLFGSAASAQNDTCNITNLAAEVISCDSGFVTVRLNFQHENTSNLGFQVLGGTGINPVLGTFTYAAVPVTVGPIPTAVLGGLPLTLTVQDLGNLNCSDDVIVGPLSCTGSCEITNFQVEAFDCNLQDSTFKLSIKFEAFNAGNDFFEVFGPGNEFLGSFAINELPITVEHFPWNGNPVGGSFVQVCIQDNPNCCVFKQFQLPAGCVTAPPGDSCEIHDLSVQVGDCTSDSTYTLTINFNAVTSDSLSNFNVYANGDLYENYPLSALPVTIENFPYNGGKKDVVRVCLNPDSASGNCCENRTFNVPTCLPGVGGNPLPCRIRAIKATVGTCTSDSTYRLTLQFTARNPDNDTVTVYAANGDTIGHFPLDSMPIVIDSFPWNGYSFDSVTVCLSDNCCRVRRFGAPGCLPGLDCKINDIYVKTLDCTSDSTYSLVVGFKVAGATSDSFTITTSSGAVVGQYSIDSLPITIADYPWGGGGLDTFTICLNSNDTSAAPCCKSRRVQTPDCLQAACEIYDLFVKAGDCNNDGTYDLTIRFKASNPDADEFTVSTGDGGTTLGTFTMADLPLTIENFPNSAGKRDSVLVCFTNNCCKMKRFNAPDCGPSSNCNINDLSVDPGVCDSTTGTYSLVLNFNASGVDSSGEFEVKLNNTISLGTFSVSELPITIPSILSNPIGGLLPISVCLVGQPNCCETVNFQQPNCNNNSGPCEIVDLVVDSIGACNPDGGFDIVINFHYGANTQADSFNVSGNGVDFGTFAFAALPLVVQNFPGTSGSTPEVTVCAVGNPNCCETVEFQAPNCTPNLDSCSIYDLQVLATPCINGQFFAILTFGFDSTGSNGFSISGNGNSYGTFNYDVTQPIILGPLAGGQNGQGTNYEFVVTDNLNPDCTDFFSLGVIDCDLFVSPDDRGAALLQGKLGFMPNPVVDRLTAVTLLTNGTTAGEGRVMIISADGRIVRTTTVPESSAFNLNVADLVPGMYRVVVQSASGHTDGTFIKQ